VNYEVGLRLSRAGAATEIVGFFNDYANLLGRDTLSAGGSGEGDLFNGGEARVYGVEASAQWNPLERTGARVSVPLRLAYTFTSAEFRNSFSSRYEPWGAVLAGDRLPYVPAHQLFFSVDLDRQVWRMRLDASHVGRMRTAAGRGPYGSSATDTAFILGLSGERAIGAGATVFGSVQNLADRSYVAARHPFGARPGLPRTLTVGLRFLVGR
jgi:Fe(3+) dicitrate transport protein